MVELDGGRLGKETSLIIEDCNVQKLNFRDLGVVEKIIETKELGHGKCLYGEY